MTQEQKNNPLHGVKLEALLKELVDAYNWEILAQEINLNCFKTNPSIKSSLKFLRRTEWAREKVERFYLYDYKKLPRPGKDQFDTPARKRVVDSTKPSANTKQSSTKHSSNSEYSNNTHTDSKATEPTPKLGKFNPWEKSSKAGD